jgi:hypothetical protein
MDFEPVGAMPVRSFKLATAELANAHHVPYAATKTKCAYPNTLPSPLRPAMVNFFYAPIHCGTTT